MWLGQIRIPIWPGQIPDLANFLFGLRMRNQYPCFTIIQKINLFEIDIIQLCTADIVLSIFSRQGTYSVDPGKFCIFCSDL